MSRESIARQLRALRSSHAGLEHSYVNETLDRLADEGGRGDRYGSVAKKVSNPKLMEIVQELKEALCSKCGGEGCDACEETGLHGVSGEFVRDVIPLLESLSLKTVECERCDGLTGQIASLLERAANIATEATNSRVSVVQDLINDMEELISMGEDSPVIRVVGKWKKRLESVFTVRSEDDDQK